MNQDETKMQDELRPEYDLRTLQVRKVGVERTHVKNEKARWNIYLLDFCFREHKTESENE